MAAALVYVADRAAYRFGKSTPLLNIVDIISKESPTTPIGPQVILRQARVKKDTGDLHTAMRVLDQVVERSKFSLFTSQHISAVVWYFVS